MKSEIKFFNGVFFYLLEVHIIFQSQESDISMIRNNS